MECFRWLVPGALKGGAPKKTQQTLNFGAGAKNAAPAASAEPAETSTVASAEAAGSPTVGIATPCLETLEGCGGEITGACLQDPQCMRHAMYAEIAAVLEARQGLQTPPAALRPWGSPVGDLAVETTPMQSPAASPISSCAWSLQHSVSKESVTSECSLHEKGSKEWIAEKGRKGAEGRKRWLEARKKAGAKKRTNRKKPSLEKEEACVKYVLEQKPAFTKFQSIAEGAWWAEAAEYMQVTKDQMKNAWRNREKVLISVKKVNEAKSPVFRNRYARQRYEARDGGASKKKNAPGAGRKRILEDMTAELKVEIEAEEGNYGHNLGPDSIFQMYVEKMAKEAMELLKTKKAKEETGGSLTKQEEEKLKCIRSRMANREEHAKHGQQLKRDILEALDRKVHSIARKTTLSHAEEELRMHLTWQSHDYVQNACSFDGETLKDFVCKPKEFLNEESQAQLVYEYEDEIGIWLGLQSYKTTLPAAQAKQQAKRARLHSKTVKQIEKTEEFEKEDPYGGMKQVRGVEGKGQDKKRITVLHRLILEEPVQTKTRRKRPRGVMDRTVVTFPGSHGCADYFDDDEHGDARWNRDWEYDYLGEHFEFKKGALVGNRMQQLQMIKRAFPELAEKYLLTMQPAAFRDGIIVAMCMEDLHRRRKYVYQQHDLVGIQATQEVKKRRFLYMQPDTNIAAEMTACSQATDIMIAHPAKSISRAKMPEIRQWMKANARKNNTEVSYKVGFLEMLMLVDEIDKGLRKWLEEFDFIFHAVRQGGHLAYLPDLEKGRLVTVEDAAAHWPEMPVPVGKEAKDAEPKVPKLGGGKLDYTWLKDRYSWRNAVGVPKKPDWQEMDGVVVEKDLWKYDEDADKCITMPMETEGADGGWTMEEQEIFDENAALLQSHPTVRDAVYTKMWEKLKTAEGAKEAKKNVKKAPMKTKKSERIRRAALPTAEDWRGVTLAHMADGYSAEELAVRVPMQAKPKYKSGALKRHFYKSTTGAICLKTVGAKLKEALEQKKVTSKMVKEKGSMVGKTLKLCKDLCVYFFVSFVYVFICSFFFCSHISL